MSKLGKLQLLNSIGRVKSFDIDEPPDDDSEVDNLILEYETQEHGYKYDPEHAYSTAEELAKSFKVLQPGNHVCKRLVEGTSSFTHCKESIKFAEQYKKLRKLLENKAKLELIREYCVKISQCAALVTNLEEIVQEEHYTWDAICKQSLQSPPSTKLEHVASVCEDLRIIMHHWNSLKQLVHTNPWLRSQVPTLCFELEPVKEKLRFLRNSAVWWIERLIHRGLKVLAHCDPSNINQDVLWSINRGLEEYNSIVEVLKYEQKQEMFYMQDSSKLCANTTLKHCIRLNSACDLLESVRPVSFTRILQCLASERSKYIAAIAHNFFTTNTEFLSRISSEKLPEFTWGEDKPANLTSKGTAAAAIESSDYYTQTGSNASLGSALLRVGPITAPDLSKQNCPVTEFAKREHEFAMKFIQVVNHSTRLLIRSSNRSRHSTGGAALLQCGAQTRSSFSFHKLDARLFGASPLPKSKSDHSSLLYNSNPAVSYDSDNDTVSLMSEISMASSTRKSVSWCDASDVSVARKFADKYMKLLWQCFAQELLKVFHDPVFHGGSEARSQLGCISLLPDMIVQIVTSMMQQTCMKDLVPPGAERGLWSVCQQLVESAALAAWDQGYTAALGSAETDKCAPVPLHGDLSNSSATARQVRDALTPLLCCLEALGLPDIQPQTASKDNLLGARLCPKDRVPSREPSSEEVSHDDTDANPAPAPLTNRNRPRRRRDGEALCARLHSLLLRFVLTAELGLRWCLSKSHESLTQGNMATFLLVVNSDLKMIGDAVCAVVRRSGGIEAALEGASEQGGAAGLSARLTDINTQLQKLSGACLKRFAARCRAEAAEFFRDSMPAGKAWRGKGSTDLPTVHSEYIEGAVGHVLSDVVGGVARLAPAAQISCLSVAVTALAEAWTQHILQTKIRFSYLGACQLSLDVHFLHTCLSRHVQHEHVRASVLGLGVFKQLHAISQLLLQQPPGAVGKGGVARSNAVSHCDTGNTDIELTTDTQLGFDSQPSLAATDFSSKRPRLPAAATSPQPPPRGARKHSAAAQQPRSRSAASRMRGESPPEAERRNGVARNGQNGGGAVAEQDGGKQYRLANEQQWLDLRVQGGGRHWPKFPNCFNKDN